MLTCVFKIAFFFLKYKFNPVKVVQKYTSYALLQNFEPETSNCTLLWPAASVVLRFNEDKPFTLEISVDHDDCDSYPNEDSSEKCKYEHVYLSQRNTGMVALLSKPEGSDSLCDLLLFVFQTISVSLRDRHPWMQKRCGVLLEVITANTFLKNLYEQNFKN